MPKGPPPTGVSCRCRSADIDIASPACERPRAVRRLIGHASGDDAAARQREIDLVGLLSIAEVERPPAARRGAAGRRQRHVSVSRDEDVVAAGGKLGELVQSFRVRGGASVDAQLCRRDAHLRAPKRSAGIGGDDAAANAGGALRNLGGAPSRGGICMRGAGGPGCVAPWGIDGVCAASAVQRRRRIPTARAPGVRALIGPPVFEA